MDSGVWKWPIGWFSQYRVLNDIQVPMLNESEKDNARWVDNQGKLVEFFVKNVQKDRNEEGQKVKWKSIMKWMVVQHKLLRQNNEMEA